MNKTKSVICLVFITLVIAVLCVTSTLTFSYNDGLNTYHSFISVMEKDAALGGGYSVVYYPDGVISAEEYLSTLGGMEEESEREEFTQKYASYADGSLYLEKDKVFGEDGKVSGEFQTSFQNALETLRSRFERISIAGTRVETADDYSIRVTLSQLAEAAGIAFRYFAYTGEFSVAYGSDENSATRILPKRSTDVIGTFIKGASMSSSRGTPYVMIHLTKEGREQIKTATAEASSESSSTMYFKVGGETVIPMSVTSAIDDDTIVLSGDSYTADTANVMAILIDEAVNGVQTDLSLTIGELQSYEAGMGGHALTFIYSTVGGLIAAMMIFFFIRYRLLAFAHLYSFLAFLLSMILCLAFMPYLYLSAGTLTALLITACLLCVGNVAAFESARKEYALGKRMSVSVKNGYQKCFWRLFDLHIVLALLAFLGCAIAVTELQTFLFAFGLGTIFSGVCTLVVNRFMWYLLMKFAKDEGKFCHFQGGDSDD